MKTINSKKNKKPKLLVQVLQAVQDLRRTHGSTLKRIADQVQMAVKCSKIKPPPRNVFGQVRRALKYGIKAGILKHRSGKFRLATKTEINYALQRGNKHNRRRQKKAKRKRKTKRKSRIRKPLYVAPLSPDTVNQMNNYSNVADQEQAVPETDSSYNHVVNAATKRRRKTKTTTKRRKRKTTGDRSSRRRRKRKQKQDEFCMAHNFDDIDERNCFGKDKDYNQMGMYLPAANERSECDNSDCVCNMGQNMDNCKREGSYDSCRNCNNNNNSNNRC